jgi:hypothetical protein
LYAVQFGDGTGQGVLCSVRAVLDKDFRQLLVLHVGVDDMYAQAVGDDDPSKPVDFLAVFVRDAFQLVGDCSDLAQLTG